MAHENSVPQRAMIISTVILIGLILDQQLEFWGQTLTNLLVWALLLHWLRQAQGEERWF